MGFIIGVILMYLFAGVIFLANEKRKAKKIIKQTMDEISQVSTGTKEEKVYVALKRYSMKSKQNLLKATWKEQLIIITLWVFIIENYKRA